MFSNLLETLREFVEPVFNIVDYIPRYITLATDVLPYVVVVAVVGCFGIRIGIAIWKTIV